MFCSNFQTQNDSSGFIHKSIESKSRPILEWKWTTDKDADIYSSVMKVNEVLQNNTCVMVYLNNEWKPGLRALLPRLLVPCDKLHSTYVLVCQRNILSSNPPVHTPQSRAVLYIDLLWHTVTMIRKFCEGEGDLTYNTQSGAIGGNASHILNSKTVQLLRNDLKSLLNYTSLKFRKIIENVKSVDMCMDLITSTESQFQMPETHSISSSKSNRSLINNKYLCEFSYLGYQRGCIILKKSNILRSLPDFANSTATHSYLPLLNALLQLGFCRLHFKIKGRWTNLKTDNQLCDPSGKAMMVQEKVPKVNKQLCGDLHYTCNSGDCVQASFVKDGQPDCYDGSDELSAGINTSVLSDYRQFECDHKHKHIAWFKVCDGITDCTDSTDESL